MVLIKNYVFYKIVPRIYLVQQRLPSAIDSVTKYINTSLVDLVVDKEKKDEKAAEINEHGFNDIMNNYGTKNDDSVDDYNGNSRSEINDHNVLVKKGYTSTHTIYTECTRIVIDQGLLSIANEYFVGTREIQTIMIK